LQIGCRDSEDFADSFPQLSMPGKSHSRHAAVVVANHMYDAIAFNRSKHPLGFGRRYSPEDFSQKTTFRGLSGRLSQWVNGLSPGADVYKIN